MMKADRARGLTVREVAARYGVSLALAHRVVSDVHIMLPNRWHRARQRETPAPYTFRLHGLMQPRASTTA
ncbi:MAG TPA: hypothetical protein PKC60_00395 [Hydrogenophaga sp.]|uniref:hypothetical protein n=1 Tax=Hydrogenophaga sp. TaxID=1904254 RepID=UPI002CD427F5|nr:hypothetical protein [Hydrogenophaga sp.]HMN91664.1 hypothetical protein [Hydrogenophaga sp.]HMP09964.1 hypothetical protein [Hydrogenophaga sp.]